MSLQIAAKHLAAKGRGPDTTLVHMTNKEVQGLQALAEKNGGSLSINPETGLPEAGFLESILPVVAGVGLTAAGMGPMAAALTVGGVSALSTGSLSKGLFAGLGAYGGASLGEQLAVQGMGEAAAANASFGDKLAGMGDASAFSSFENAGKFISANKLPAMAGIAGPLLSSMEDERENDKPAEPVKDTDPGARARSGIKYNPGWVTPTPLPNPYGIEQTYNQPYYGAEGGSAHMAEGGMAYGGSTSRPIDTKTQFADYLTRVMNPTNRANAVSGNPYSWWKSPGAPAAPVTPPAETPEEYAARTRTSTGGGGGRDREPEDPNSFSAQWAAMSDAEKEAFRLENPKIAAAQDLAMLVGAPFMWAYNKIQEAMGPDSSTGGPARYSAPPVTPDVSAPTYGGYPEGYSPNPYSMGPGTPGFNAIPTGPTKGAFLPSTPTDETTAGIPNDVLKQLIDDSNVAASESAAETSFSPPPREATTPEAQAARIAQLQADAVAQTNAALTPAEYTFQPNAVQDMLANSALPESNKILDKYLAENANIAPTQYEGIVSAEDLGSQFPGPTTTTTQEQIDRIRALTEAPESQSRAQQLMRNDVDLFSPLSYSAADEADRMFAVPDIVDTESRQERDVPSVVTQTTDPFAAVSRQEADIPEALSRQERDVPGEISAETATAPKVVDLKTEETPVEQAIADLAPLIAGLPDASTSTSFTTPARGLAAIGGMYGGLGSVWRGADGLPVVGGDGNAILTSQGAAENAYNASPEGVAAANAAETKSLQNRYQIPTPTINPVDPYAADSDYAGNVSPVVSVPTINPVDPYAVDSDYADQSFETALVNAMLNPTAVDVGAPIQTTASLNTGITSDAGPTPSPSDGGNYSNEGRNAPAPAPAPAPPSNDNYSNEGRNSAPPAPAPAPPSNDNYSNEGRNSEGGGGGGGGGGGRVICTHFYRKGEMSRNMWRSDLEFTFKNLSPTTVRGYQYWAIPYVKLMRKSKLAENIMRPLAMHRAKELSYQMGRSAKGSLFGKVVRLIGEPICFTVGLFVGEQNWQSLWNPAKD